MDAAPESLHIYLFSKIGMKVCRQFCPYSVLEEFFFMNFDIKLDENNEDNINLYVGDLHLKVKVPKF